MDESVPSLPQAATSSNVPGALQQMLLARVTTPQQAQAQTENRQNQLAQYQQALREDPSPGYSALDHSLYSWIGNIGHARPAIAAMQGIAAGGQFRGTQAAKNATNDIEAAKAGYNDAVFSEKQSDAELKGLGSLAKVGGGTGWVTKMDKDGNMVSYNPATNEKRIVHASQGAAYQRAWTTLYNRAVEEGMPNPEEYAHTQAVALLGQAPSAVKPGQETPIPSVSGATSQTEGNVTPSPAVGSNGDVLSEQANRNIPMIQEEMKRTTSPERLRILKQELEREQQALGKGSPALPDVKTTSPNPNQPGLVYKDKAEEARRKEFATGMEQSSIKDYEENVRTPAAVADNMLNNIAMLRQIPRTQDAFAPYREKVGSVMNALGLDGKMVGEAKNLQQIRPILAKVANDRLLLAKGVQTEGDAQRAYNEFIKISDTQKAVDFMYAWAEELANRAKFKKRVYDLASQEKGSLREGSQYWDRTDYAKAAPVAILNNRPWTFTDWRNKFMKANPDATPQNAVEEWNKLAGRK